jgi:hypothetical protein
MKESMKRKFISLGIGKCINCPRMFLRDSQTISKMYNAYEYNCYDCGRIQICSKCAHVMDDGITPMVCYCCDRRGIYKIKDRNTGKLVCHYYDNDYDDDDDDDDDIVSGYEDSEDVKDEVERESDDVDKNVGSLKKRKTSEEDDDDGYDNDNKITCSGEQNDILGDVKDLCFEVSTFNQTDLIHYVGDVGENGVVYKKRDDIDYLNGKHSVQTKSYDASLDELLKMSSVDAVKSLTKSFSEYDIVLEKDVSYPNGSLGSLVKDVNFYIGIIGDGVVDSQYRYIEFVSIVHNILEYFSKIIPLKQ